MKLLAYDKFFDALIKLPRDTQKKVIEFQKKFRSDPKSPAIHLEPISTFKDPSLRTARIDKQYRAIIKAPQTGDTYYILWVDKHDEAMAWAENKIFHWNENTQAIQVFSAPEIIEESAQNQNYGVAEKKLFDQYTDKELIKIGVPEVLLSSIRNLDDLNDLEKMERFLPADAFENLFYLADGADLQAILTEIEEGKLDTTIIEQQENSLNNRRNFIELTDDDIFNEVLSGELKKWKFYLHPSQRKLVEGDFNGPVKITGGAGTGKTVAAIHRLKHLINHLNDSRLVVFTTFTKALTSNLKEVIEDIKIDKDKYLLINIDALVFDLAKEYGLIEPNSKVLDFTSSKSSEDIWDEVLETNLSPFDRDFLKTEYQEVILYHNIGNKANYLTISRLGRGKPISRRQRMDLWELVEKYKSKKTEQLCYDKNEVFNLVTSHLNNHKLHPFSHCIADELQDMGNVELRFIRALVEEKPNDIFMVGDPLQKIYSKTINFSQAGINVKGKRSRKLKINYRTSEEIKKTAIAVLQGISFDDFDGEKEKNNGYVSLFHGEKPKYEVFRTKDEEYEFVLNGIKQILDSGYKYSDIAISARTRNGAKDFRSVLHNNNIPYYDFIAGTPSGSTEGVRILTFHNTKGLEFKAIFLVDVNERTFPFLPNSYQHWEKQKQEEYLKSEKSLLYVAMSRAVHWLSVSGVGNKAGIEVG